MAKASPSNTDDAVRDQLARLIDSPDFQVPERLRRFLTFVVEESLAGRGDRLKAYAIATKVFGRSDDFDVTNDPVVRIEAGRLRRALERYYLLGGRDDPVHINIPKGTYTPLITFRPQPTVEEVAEHLPITRLNGSTTALPRLAWLAMAILAVCAIGIAVAAANFSTKNGQQHLRAKNELDVTLVVQPLKNLSGPDGEIYAAGLSEELLIHLARFRELRVVGSPPQKVAETATAFESSENQYVLEGSIRIADQRLRLYSRLLDARSRSIVWSRSYERDLRGAQDLDIEADIAAQVSSAVAQPYGAIFSFPAQNQSMPRTKEADDYKCLLSFYSYRVELSRSAHLLTRNCLKELVVRHPDSATAWAMMAYLYLDEDRLDFNPEGDRAGRKKRAREAANRAVLLDPSNVRAQQALMVNLFYNKEPEAALRIGEAALALNPQDSEFIAEFGSRLAQAGYRLRGVTLLEDSIQKNPNQTKYYSAILAQNYYLLGDNERALLWIKRSSLRNFANYNFLSALIYARAGLQPEASEAAREFMKMRPNFIQNIESEIAARNYGPDDRRLLLEGARQAGFPVPPTMN